MAKDLRQRLARVNSRKAELIECEYEQNISETANTNWMKEEFNNAKYNNNSTLMLDKPLIGLKYIITQNN